MPVKKSKEHLLANLLKLYIWSAGEKPLKLCLSLYKKIVMPASLANSMTKSKPEPSYNESP